MLMVIKITRARTVIIANVRVLLTSCPDTVLGAFHVLVQLILATDPSERRS